MTPQERAAATIRTQWSIVLEHGSKDPLDVVSRLHAIVCMDFGWDYVAGQKRMGEIVDRVAIAAEIDRIHKAVFAAEPVPPPEGLTL